MKFSSIAHALVLLTSSLPSISAWGGLGHETVAFVASNFVSANTQTYFQSILGNMTPEYLANVSTWADSFRYTKAGRFSEPFHFIDSKDNPPASCSVTYARDCGKTGCVVRAIQNYTSRLMDASLPHSERVMAAKFIIHFVGDVHQPLHDENLSRGGNGIKVVFGGTETNLHAVWDTFIPEKLVGGYSLINAQKWAASLSTNIESGTYQPQVESWLQGMDIANPVASAMIWATEANKYVCSTVMPEGPSVLEGQELDGDYYTAAVPVVQLQIARAGYRLAAWMDFIASGSETLEL